MRRATCLALLGVRELSPATLKEAYRRKLKEYHPDLFSGDPRCWMLVRRAFGLLVAGGPFDGEDEALAKALFVLEERFDFPELPVSSPVPVVREPGPQRLESPSPELILERKADEFVERSVLVGLVADLLRRASISLPPVDPRLVAKALGLRCRVGVLQENYQNCNRRFDNTVYAGTIRVEEGQTVIETENLYNTDVDVQRYVLAKMVGYAVLYPGKERTEIVGDLLRHWRSWDVEEFSTHLFAEYLLMPDEMVSRLGGEVVWRLFRGPGFTWEAFCRRMRDLFKVPEPLLRRRLAPYERRLQILSQLTTRPTLPESCEELLY